MEENRRLHCVEELATNHVNFLITLLSIICLVSLCFAADPLSPQFHVTYCLCGHKIVSVMPLKRKIRGKTVMRNFIPHI